MFKKIQYNADGRIIGMVTSSERYIDVDPDFNPSGHYVDLSIEPPRIESQIDYPFEYNVSGLEVTITGVPRGLTLDLDGEKYEVTSDEPVIFRARSAGLSHLSVSGPANYVSKYEQIIIDQEGE